jgi:3-methyladenine DNA glycosylase AlkD
MPEAEVYQQFEAVRAALAGSADAGAAERDRRYHKYPEYESYGIKRERFTPLLRALRPGLRSLDLDDRLALALWLVGTGIEEEAAVAVWLLKDSIKRLGPEHCGFLDDFAGRMRSWSTTDDFSIHVVQPLLLRETQPVLQLLWTWNRSDERWKQRASVVAFTRDAGKSGRFVEETLEFCEQLIWSEDDLVRKGVGWALRDALRGDRAAVLPYVEELRRGGVSSVITLYAIGDLKGDDRQRVLDIKKRV